MHLLLSVKCAFTGWNRQSQKSVSKSACQKNRIAGWVPFYSPCYAKNFLKMLVAKKIVVSTMLENKHAQHVYEKLGFMKTAVRPDWREIKLANCAPL